MRRSNLLWSLPAVAVAGALVFAAGPDTVARQDPSDVHPIVGAWLADTSAEDPENPPATLIFHDDGTYLQSDPGGANGVGVWEEIDERTVALTILFLEVNEDEQFEATSKVRAVVELDETGDAFSAEYTAEFIEPDGSSFGEVGPGTATGERIAIEEMGDPVMSMEEAFGGEAGTPTP